MQDEEKRYQIAKDLSDNLTISYNTSEVVMARLQQTTNAKERIYAQSITFFSTNDSVLTALKASFTGMFGLHESTADAERDEGGRVEVARDALRDRRQGAGGGGAAPATARPSAPTRSRSSSTPSSTSRSARRRSSKRCARPSTQNSAEIRDAVEDGKRRIAKLVADGKALPLCMTTADPRRCGTRPAAAAPRTLDERHARDGRGRHAAPSRAAGRARAQRGACAKSS